MTQERVQELFESIKLHFNTKSYDFFKYSGKLRKPPKIHPSANYLLSKIPDEDHLIYYFLANQIQYYSENGRFCTFLPEIVGVNQLSIYNSFISQLKNLKASMYSELESIKSMNLNKEMTDIDSVLRMYYSNKLSLFTILHFYKFTNLSTKWKDTENPLALEFLGFIQKLSPFMNFKKEIFLNILKKLLVV